MKTRSIIAACSLGNFLEWYDFALYGYLSTILARLFFPAQTEFAGLTNIFLVFAVGFLMRPLGSVVFGIIGDRRGRKWALILSIMLITMPTLLMGMLPTYAQIGIMAPIFMTCLRFFQGIPIGGEIGGVMCYLVETAPPAMRGFFGSWAFFGSNLGFIFSSLEIYFFEKWMPPDVLGAWGWRFSFIAGGLIGMLGWYLRWKLVETPPFQSLAHHHQILKTPLSTLLNTFRKEVFNAVCLSAFSAGGFYLLYLFSTIYFYEILKINIIQNLLINTGLLCVSLVFLPIFGKLGDRYGIKRLFILSLMGAISLPYPMFYYALHHELVLALFIQIVLILCFTLNSALLPTVLAAIFPASVRYTGVGLSYNLSNALLGGTAPLISLYLIQMTGSDIAPAFFFIFLGVVSIIPFKTVVVKLN